MTTATDLAHARNRFIWIDAWIHKNTYPMRKPPLCRKKMDQAIRLRARARASYRAALKQWNLETWDTPKSTATGIEAHMGLYGTRYHDNVKRHEGLE